eukprot:UN27364
MRTNKNTHVPVMQSGFASVVRETADVFKADQIQVLGEGYKDVLGDSVLFEKYVEQLSSGLSANESADFALLMDNARLQTLQESQTAAIAPIHGLQGPMLRQFWPRVGAIHAIPTEPTEVPSFSVSYMTPYIKDRETGERIAVPKALRRNRSAVQRATLETGDIALPQQGYDLFQAAGGTKLAGDAIDVDFVISEATIKVLDAGGVNEETVAVPLRSRMDANTSQVTVEVTAAHSDGTVTTDTVFVGVERREGLLTGGSVLNAVASIKIKGFLASDNNNRSTEVGFDIDKRDVNVSTGAPLDAPIPTSFLQDTMAL